MFYFNEFDLVCWLWRRVVVIGVWVGFGLVCLILLGPKQRNQNSHQPSQFPQVLGLLVGQGCHQSGMPARRPATAPKRRLLNAWNGVCHCTTVWKRRHNSFSLAWSGVPSPPLALDLLFVFLKNVLVKMGTATKLRYQLSDVYSPLSPKNITYIYIYQALKIHAFLSTLEHTWIHCLPMMNKIWIF